MQGNYNNGFNTVRRVTSPFVWYQIITSLIGAFLFICALIYLNFFFRRNYKSTKATVLSQTCTEKVSRRKGKETTRDACTTDIEFKHEGEIYNKTLDCQGVVEAEVIGEDDEYDEIEIEYDPNDLSKVECKFHFKYVFNIALVVFLIFSLLTAAFYYFFRRNAAVGVIAGFDTLGDRM